MHTVVSLNYKLFGTKEELQKVMETKFVGIVKKETRTDPKRNADIRNVINTTSCIKFIKRQQTNSDIL